MKILFVLMPFVLLSCKESTEEETARINQLFDKKAHCASLAASYDDKISHIDKELSKDGFYRNSKLELVCYSKKNVTCLGFVYVTILLHAGKTTSLAEQFYAEDLLTRKTLQVSQISDKDSDREKFDTFRYSAPKGFDCVE